MRATNFPSDIKTFSQKAEDILHDHIIKALYGLGEKYDRIIRERGEEQSWRDLSGNLRSSVGAAVYSKGRLIIRTSFEAVLGGSIGSARGRQMAEELASQYTDAFHLALFAAMPYAEKVEAIDGKDVLSSAIIGIEREINKVVRGAVKEAEIDIQKEADRL